MWTRAGFAEPSERTKQRKKACKGSDRVVDDGRENYSTDVLKEKAITFVKAAAAEGKPFSRDETVALLDLAELGVAELVKAQQKSLNW